MRTCTEPPSRAPATIERPSGPTSPEAKDTFLMAEPSSPTGLAPRGHRPVARLSPPDSAAALLSGGPKMTTYQVTSDGDGHDLVASWPDLPERANHPRSEERRVGKECKSRGSPY